jgi:Zn-dependent M28 family amino/carboxypeptidase
MITKKTFKFAFILTALIGVFLIFLLARSSLAGQKAALLGVIKFDGSRAMQDIRTQLAFGPRVVGSQAHQDAVEWMVEELKKAGWDAGVSESTINGIRVQNVVGKYGEGRPWLILGAHYDSRLVADRDPKVEFQKTPVPAANDGASGVALLLEMARILPDAMKRQADPRYSQIWIVFFDAEDNGKLPGWDWILGSRAFAEGLDENPDAVVVVDMIGDADLNIYKEKNSNPMLVDQIWNTAASLGYSKWFIPKYLHGMLDDHTPFLEKGIPAVDLIDFEYPYYHTLSDTADKVSGKSLDIVGNVLLKWILSASSD